MATSMPEPSEASFDWSKYNDQLEKKFSIFCEEYNPKKWPKDKKDFMSTYAWKRVVSHIPFCHINPADTFRIIGKGHGHEGHGYFTFDGFKWALKELHTLERDREAEEMRCNPVSGEEERTGKDRKSIGEKEIIDSILSVSRRDCQGYLTCLGQRLSKGMAKLIKDGHATTIATLAAQTSNTLKTMAGSTLKDLATVAACVSWVGPVVVTLERIWNRIDDCKSLPKVLEDFCNFLAYLTDVIVYIARNKLYEAQATENRISGLKEMVDDSEALCIKAFKKCGKGANKIQKFFSSKEYKDEIGKQERKLLDWLHTLTLMQQCETQQTLKEQSKEMQKCFKEQGEETQKCVQEQGGETQKCVKEQGEETQKCVKEQGGETQKCVKKQGEETQKCVKEQGGETQKCVQEQGEETQKCVKEQGEEIQKKIDKLHVLMSDTRSQGDAGSGEDYPDSQQEGTRTAAPPVQQSSSRSSPAGAEATPAGAEATPAGAEATPAGAEAHVAAAFSQRRVSNHSSIKSIEAHAQAIQDGETSSSCRTEEPVFDEYGFPTNLDSMDYKKIPVPECEYPQCYKDGQYDGLLVFHDDDEKEAMILKKTLENMKHEDGKNIRICHLGAQDEGKPESFVLNELCKKSTYYLLYMTKSFCRPDNGLPEACQHSLICKSARESRWCVIPVHTDKDWRNQTTYKVTVLLEVAGICIEASDWEGDAASMFAREYHQRQERENTMERDLCKWKEKYQRGKYMGWKADKKKQDEEEKRIEKDMKRFEEELLKD